MNRWSQKRLTFEMIVRMLADALMVNAALIAALAIQFIWRTAINGEVSATQEVLRRYVDTYRNTFWLLTLLDLTVFYLNGFYTYGRMYRGRYKLLVIAQAVSLSYLVFGFLVYLFPRLLSIPRGVLILAWVMTLVLLISARLWSMLWKVIIRQEQDIEVVSEEHKDVENVLVIGGAGYIGSGLLPRLLDKGYKVRLLDLLVFGTQPIANVIGHPNLEIVQADFLQVNQVVAAMRDVDAVIHLGAIVGDPACALNEDLTVSVNLEATRMIAEIAKGSGVQRFIFASTCSVYGAGDEILDERSALNPVSLYARSKIASEKILVQLADDRFAPILLRFGTIYGLSGRTRFDLVINLLTAKAVIDGQITVLGGDQWRPFVHVNDAGLAVFKALEAPLSLVRNQVYNVGSNAQNYTVQQVAEIIQRLVPTAELINRGSDSDRRNYRVNFDKIRRTLDFVPQWSVEQGVQQVIEAIQSGKVRNYRDTKYSNVRSLQLHHLIQQTFNGNSHQRALGQRGWIYELLGESASVFVSPPQHSQNQTVQQAQGALLPG